jgi:hypothetical protein
MEGVANKSQAQQEIIEGKSTNVHLFECILELKKRKINNIRASMSHKAKSGASRKVKELRKIFGKTRECKSESRDRLLTIKEDKSNTSSC